MPPHYRTPANATAVQHQQPVYYSHTQTGWFTLLALAAVILMVVSIFLSSGEMGIGLLLLLGFAMATVAVCGVIFSSLTATVTRETLGWHFGPGWPRWSIAIDEIAGVARVRPAWWWGWGIRWTPSGWLYNVSGRNAVIVHRRDGSSVLIGTDEPHELAVAIQKAMAERGLL